jgi:hypothetical protein
MKRSPIKRKTPMKRKAAPKKKGRRKSYSTLKQEAWVAFSKYIRIRDSLATTGTTDRCVCITCGKTVPSFRTADGGNSLQAGHAIDKRTNNILFDEDIVNGQCSLCNSTYGGNGRYAEYASVIIGRHGKEWWDEKVRTARLPAKMPWRAPDLIAIKEKYELKTTDLLLAACLDDGGL